MDVYIANKEAKQKKKGVTGYWGLLLIGLLAGGSYLWDLKKKKEAQAAAQQAYRDRLLPPVKQKIILPLETSGSAESRLKGMGVNPDIPSPYQKTGTNYKEV